MSLRSSARFSDIYRSGTRIRRGGMTVIVDASSAPLPEVGFVAGKRVGNAVRRNRAKRRMRAAAQHARFDQGHAYVVVASPEVPEVAFETLVEWLTSAVDTARTGETA